MITTVWSILFTLIMRSVAIEKAGQTTVPTAPVTVSDQQELSNISEPVSPEPENYSQTEKLAKCLSAKGAKMYGAYWCPHCADQKKMFGSAFQFIKYTECDPKGPNADAQACQTAAIESYPTWMIPDGERLNGTTSLKDLAKWSSCQY